MRLLIVEDELKTGNYLKQGLTEAGFQVSLARNGLDGHHLAMTELFDVIILDVMLLMYLGGEFYNHFAKQKNRPLFFFYQRETVSMTELKDLN